MRNLIRLSLLFCSLSILVLPACKDSTGGDDPPATSDAFDRNSLDKYTIYNTPQAWAVLAGQLRADTSARQSVVIRNGVTFANGWVETETDLAADGGLVLRFQSAGNYYLMAIRDDSQFWYANLEIYRAFGGVFMALGAPVDVPFAAGARNTFRFQANGPVLTGYMNGIPVIQAHDAAYTSGGFGLRHDNSREWTGVTSRFDLLRWHAD